MPPNNEKKSEPQGGLRPRGPRAALLYFLIAAIVLFFIAYQGMRPKGDQVTTLAANEFVVALKEGRVDSATYRTSTGEIFGEYWAEKGDVGDEEKLAEYTSTYVGVDHLDELMASHPAFVS